MNNYIIRLHKVFKFCEIKNAQNLSYNLINKIVINREF